MNARDALARLYDDCAAQAFGFLLRMVREPAWAEDLLQEAFLRLAPRIESLREPRRYLWRTAAHLALDGLRRRRRLDPAPLDEVAEPADRALDGASAEESDDAEALRRAVADLPPRERAALLLRTTARLTFAEVGEAMGLTDRGAARLHDAAVERLRRRLAPREPRNDLAPRRRTSHGPLAH